MVAKREYTVLKGFRYERKYLVQNLKDFQVENIIKINPAFFKEIYTERYINNIYFDTPRFDFYFDNTVGRPYRVKYRIRWYGDLYGKISNPILELKIKQGLVGTKRSFELESFDFSSNFNYKNLKNVFDNSKLPDDVLVRLNNLTPTLVNRYKRKYFIDFSNKFRITVDKNISYFPIQNQINSGRFFHKDLKSIVVELKYDNELNEDAKKISNKLPFRLTKNSKYVTGVQQFYDLLD